MIELMKTGIVMGVGDEPNSPFSTTPMDVVCDETKFILVLSRFQLILSTVFRIYNLIALLLNPMIPDFIKYNLGIDLIYLMLAATMNDFGEKICIRLIKRVQLHIWVVLSSMIYSSHMYFMMQLFRNNLEKLYEIYNNQIIQRVSIHSFIVIQSDNKLKLREVNTDGIMIEKELNEDHCPIGFDSFEEGEIITELECGHQFKEHNLIQWLKIRMKCPLCNRVVKLPNFRAVEEDTLWINQENIDMDFVQEGEPDEQEMLRRGAIALQNIQEV